MYTKYTQIDTFDLAILFGIYIYFFFLFSFFQTTWWYYIDPFNIGMSNKDPFNKKNVFFLNFSQIVFCMRKYLAWKPLISIVEFI